MTDSRPIVLVLFGATASGKTETAIQLANALQAEIFSFDSRQFYTELNIGVARPSKEELGAANHHFIGHKSIEEPYSAGQFARDCSQKLETYFAQNEIAIMVGGSGFFAQAVYEGLDEMPDIDPDLRARLNQHLTEKGLENLTKLLLEKDENALNQVELTNPRRVLRALELVIQTGKPLSEIKKGQKKERPYDVLKLAIDRPREEIYRRINNRVDSMMENGLFNEVKNLAPKKELNALKTVGYQEIYEYLEGSISLERAVELIKQHSRNYAKRQLTWLRKMEVDLNLPMPLTDQMIEEIKIRISNRNL